jgi:hypothetical protein
MNAIPEDILADMQAVANGDRNPELVRRVMQRSKQAQEELLQQYGIREIAADLIRQARDEE